MSEPMITIKKADGTMAKITMSEFKAMKNKKTAVPPAAPVVLQHHKPAAHHVVKHHPVHIKEPASHPVAHPSGSVVPISSAGRENKAHPVKQMSRADASSLLEEKLTVPALTAQSRLAAGKSSAPLFSPKREKQVEEVLAKLGFSVVPEVLGRLKSLVLAKLKDIKSEEETRELLSRSIKNGGLGLTEQQVEKIIRSCREVEGGEEMENTNVPVLKGNSFSASLHSLESELELPAPPQVVSYPPFTKRGQGEMPKTSLGSSTSATPSSLPLGKGEMTFAKMVNESMANAPAFKLDSRPVMKQSMQDVTASSNEMGPVEEIKSISLTDFRRLSGNPEEAAKRLQQKMFNLQEESFVWYLDALAAYHVSPLYSEYMQAVCQSLAERKSLANVLSMKNSIKLNEAVALLEMERSL